MGGDTNRALPAIFQSGNGPSRVIPCAARCSVTVERLARVILACLSGRGLSARQAVKLVLGVDPPTRFVRGVDFDLAPVGDRMEIRLTPSSRIRVGEVVEVDYRYEADPQPEGRTATARYQLSAEYGVVAVRHGSSSRESNLGRPAALVAPADERETRTEIEAQAEWSAAWCPGMRTCLVGAWNRRAGDGVRLDNLSGDASVDCNARPLLRPGTLIRAYRLTRETSRGEANVGGSLDAGLRVAAIEVSLRYRRRWVLTGSRGATRVLFAQLVRRF